MANQPVIWKFPLSDIECSLEWSREPSYNDIVILESYLKIAKAILSNLSKQPINNSHNEYRADTAPTHRKKDGNL